MTTPPPPEDRYAHGHDAKTAVEVKHHQWSHETRANRAELHLTSEAGVHYKFSFSAEQAWFIIRKLVEIKSRMSDTKRSAL